MKRMLALLCALFLLPLCAFAAEGDPLLSVDDLLTLESSYRAFVNGLADLAIERGLLPEDERDIWINAQMGDFYQNGGYGSILTNYTPGILGYVREEDTLATLRAQVGEGVLELMTMRRFSPQDSALAGLMLTFAMESAEGAPMDVRYSLSASSGVFLKWDALLGAYVSAGMTAESDGETVVWSDQAPAEGARDVRLSVTIESALTGETIGGAELTLSVDDDGYRVADGALRSEEP